jgi:hypothetical protein
MSVGQNQALLVKNHATTLPTLNPRTRCRLRLHPKKAAQEWIRHQAPRETISSSRPDSSLRFKRDNSRSAAGNSLRNKRRRGDGLCSPSGEGSRWLHQQSGERQRTSADQWEQRIRHRHGRDFINVVSCRDRRH